MKEIGDALEAAAREHRLVLLCGAGVSRPAPAGLPTVDVLVGDVLRGISSAVPEIEGALARAAFLFGTAPFEVFVAVLEQGLRRRTLEILEPLTGGSPNAMHRCIAGLMASGRASHVITTNFDNLIERALGPHRSAPGVAYGWEDVPRLADCAGPRLLKVHGSFVDVHGADIATRTVRTTIDGIFASARAEHLAAAARRLPDVTVLVVGYSGRDRLDVMPFLASLPGGRVIWVHHGETDRPLAGPPGGETPSHLKRLQRAGVDLRECVAHTQGLLESLATRLAVPRLDPSDDVPGSVPAAFRRGGFVAPILPKYAGAMGGYLLLWAANAPDAAEYALARFLRDHGDDERRVACNVLLSLGHAASRRAGIDQAERLLSAAIRGFWGLGDSRGVARGHYLFASGLLRAGEPERALDMAGQGLGIGQREGDPIGVGLLEFMAGRVLEHADRGPEAHRRYGTAAAAGAENGHPWLEAGALQGLVRTAAAGPTRGPADIERLLRSLELVHWTSGGSAPAPWMAEMVDTFRTVDTLGRLLAREDGTNATSTIEANAFLADVGLDGPIRAAVARHAREGSAP